MKSLQRAIEDPPQTGLLPSLSLANMVAMNKYEYNLEIRLDGKFYCSIYMHGIPGPIAFTDDYDTEEKTKEAAKSIIRENYAKPEEIKKDTRRCPNSSSKTSCRLLVLYLMNLNITTQRIHGKKCILV